MKSKKSVKFIVFLGLIGLFSLNLAFSGSCWQFPGTPNNGHCRDWVITWPSGAIETTKTCSDAILQEVKDCYRDPE